MSTRRDLLIFGACAAAAGSAFALTPRERLKLLTGDKLAAFVPMNVGIWRGEDVDHLIAPEEGTLAATLYSESVGRVYTNAETGAFIMMLLAYGDTQSDRLQLHRPEVCYPAFGFTIQSNRAETLGIGNSAGLPVRQLVAIAPERVENVLYWSRLGEYLPVDGRAQRDARLRTALDGKVADGLLARFSAVGTDSRASFAELDGFVRSFLTAVPKAGRPAFVGSKVAAGLG